MALEPRRGDNLPFTLTVRMDGTLYDLTGTTATFTFKHIDSGTTKTLSGVVSTDINDTDTEKATVTFNPTTDTFNTAGDCKYDVQIDNNGIRFTPTYGEFEVLQDLTV